MSIATLTMELPFVKIKVNAYLIRHRYGLLLVDTGPHAPRCYLDLKEQLAALGHMLTDVTHIVITHGHWDHFGLTAALKEVSGALVCYHKLDRSRIAEDQAEHIDLRAADERRLRHMGFSEDFIHSGLVAHETLSDRRWSLHRKVAADIYLAEGDRLPIDDNRWEVIHCPGHTPGSICLWNHFEGVLLTGDHVVTLPIADLLLEPQLYAPPGEETDTVQYIQSLDKIINLPVQIFYPGHGLPGRNLRERVESIKIWLEEQCQRIMVCLDEEPRTAFQINEMLGGLVRPSAATIIQVCQVTHFLRLLLAKSAVRADPGPDDVIHYCRS